MRWQKITIVGVGLLGGSLGLAIRRHQLSSKVVGYVRRAASVAECRRVRAVSEATQDLAAAVKDADLIVLCTPLAQMRALVEQMRPHLKRGVIVTDVGSVKSSVVRDVEALIARAGGHFVGSHPMAGAEKTGVTAARANLFDNSVCIITPTAKTNRAALKKVTDFWKAIGCRIMPLTPQAHDQLVSRTSHLPHLVAATLAGAVLHPAAPKQQAALCASGFRDTTRIASGSPEMWRDIALGNRKNLSRAVDGFVAELLKFQTALKRNDARAVAEYFEAAKQRRDAWCAGAASPSPE